MKKRAQDKFSYVTDDIGFENNSEDNYMEDTISEFEKDLGEDMDFLKKEYMEEVEEDFEQAEESLEDFFDEAKKEHGPRAKVKELIPGSDKFMEFDEEEKEEIKETDYANDGDLSKFHEYLAGKYQDIPRHDGNSIAGCDRAVAYLLGIDKEISRNIREDSEQVLDISVMSEYQEKIMRDVLLLKEHIKKLKRMKKEEILDKKSSNNSREDLMKEAAGTVKLYISVPPFIRSICGILINSVVSAGKPFDKVYDYLCKKYDITEREELEILQTLMDMGQPIFKDRGSLPVRDAKKSKELDRMEEELSGVDFITNYFH